MDESQEVEKPVVTIKPPITSTPVSKPEITVTQAELDAAYAEFMHARNGLGDGCPGCGYGGWFGPTQINNNKHFHYLMLKNVLEAAKKAS